MALSALRWRLTASRAAAVRRRRQQPQHLRRHLEQRRQVLEAATAGRPGALPRPRAAVALPRAGAASRAAATNAWAAQATSAISGSPRQPRHSQTSVPARGRRMAAAFAREVHDRHTRSIAPRCRPAAAARRLPTPLRVAELTGLAAEHAVREHRARLPAHCMCWPPLMAMLAPVTNAASSEAR